MLCRRMGGAAKLVTVGGAARRLERAKRMGANVTIDIEQARSTEMRLQLMLDPHRADNDD